jgi:hypothetical protein
MARPLRRGREPPPSRALAPGHGQHGPPHPRREPPPRPPLPGAARGGAPAAQRRARGTRQSRRLQDAHRAARAHVRGTAPTRAPRAHALFPTTQHCCRPHPEMPGGQTALPPLGRHPPCKPPSVPKPPACLLTRFRNGPAPSHQTMALPKQPHPPGPASGPAGAPRRPFRCAGLGRRRAHRRGAPRPDDGPRPRGARQPLSIGPLCGRHDQPSTATIVLSPLHPPAFAFCRTSHPAHRGAPAPEQASSSRAPRRRRRRGAWEGPPAAAPAPRMGVRPHSRGARLAAGPGPPHAVTLHHAASTTPPHCLWLPPRRGRPAAAPRARRGGHAPPPPALRPGARAPPLGHIAPLRARGCPPAASPPPQSRAPGCVACSGRRGVAPVPSAPAPGIPRSPRAPRRPAGRPARRPALPLARPRSLLPASPPAHPRAGASCAACAWGAAAAAVATANQRAVQCHRGRGPPGRTSGPCSPHGFLSYPGHPRASLPPFKVLRSTREGRGAPHPPARQPPRRARPRIALPQFAPTATRVVMPRELGVGWLRGTGAGAPAGRPRGAAAQGLGLPTTGPRRQRGARSSACAARHAAAPRVVGRP